MHLIGLLGDTLKQDYTYPMNRSICAYSYREVITLHGWCKADRRRPSNRPGLQKLGYIDGDEQAGSSVQTENHRWRFSKPAAQFWLNSHLRSPLQKDLLSACDRGIYTTYWVLKASFSALLN